MGQQGPSGAGRGRRAAATDAAAKAAAASSDSSDIEVVEATEGDLELQQALLLSMQEFHVQSASHHISNNLTAAAAAAAGVPLRRFVPLQLPLLFCCFMFRSISVVSLPKQGSTKKERERDREWAVEMGGGGGYRHNPGRKSGAHVEMGGNYMNRWRGV